MGKIKTQILMIAVALLLIACDTAIEAPEDVERIAFSIVDDVLAEILDSRQDDSGAYQHSELTISRVEEKSLTQDAIDDGVNALWCAGVSYLIRAITGDDAGRDRNAELIVLVFETDEDLGGGEWMAQSEEAQFAGIDEYNDIAFAECMGR
jgi:hypothetical protein